MSLKKVHFKWPIDDVLVSTTTASGASTPVKRATSVSPVRSSIKHRARRSARPTSDDYSIRPENGPKRLPVLMMTELPKPLPLPDGGGVCLNPVILPKSLRPDRSMYLEALTRPGHLPEAEPESRRGPEPVRSTLASSSDQTPQKSRQPVILTTKVVVRPRTVKNRSKNDGISGFFGRRRSPGIDADPWSEDASPHASRIDQMPSTTRSALDDSQLNCYGAPKDERCKKTPRSAKKSATEPIIYDIVMADPRNGHLAMANGRSRGQSPAGVEYTQIASRIVSLTYPTTGSDSAYRHSIRDISEKLRRTYPEKYKIFNVSQKRSDLGKANAGAVIELGWPDQLAPPLDRLCSICKQIENWLNLNPENIVVIHCKGWRSRAAIVIAAYMHYTNICAGGNETMEDRFSMQIFSEKYLGADGQPSHRRYVRYFANLLSGKTKVNPQPIFLTAVSLSKFHAKGLVLKIYERMKPVYSTQPLSIKSTAKIEVDSGLSLRGDVLVKCFEKRSSSERSLMFQCQFNTCALDLDPESPVLHFYREELDVITSDKSIDHHASIQFAFMFDAPKEAKRKPSKRSLSLSARESKERDASVSRADSYENFDHPEDDRSLSASVDPGISNGGIYRQQTQSPGAFTELHRTASTPIQPQASPLDGADSGIGSDSPKQMMAPQVPPKPRRPPSVPPVNDVDVDDPMRSAYEDSTIGRDHSVLPAGLRPGSRNARESRERAVSPTESNATVRSGIEPDLAPKDRYDPSSKCFSYVSAKALKEHYTAPKKPPSTLRRPSLERSNLDVSEADRDSIRSVPIQGSELPRRAETPKWDSFVDKIAPKIDLPEVRRHYRDVERDRYSNADYFTKTLPNGLHADRERDEYERPVIVNQAKRAASTTSPRRGRFGSFSQADDYNSDMDDLCDPDFYMTYSATPTLNARAQPSGGISQRELDEIDSIIQSSHTLPPQRAFTPKPQPSAAQRDAFRNRNCRSVTTAPVRKLFSNERYDATTDADNPDNWLKNKLNSLNQKRGRLPEVLARKNTERILLEELKHAHDGRGVQKDEYVAEGMGKVPPNDPLEEYQKEEERLRNTRSPFTAINDDFRAANRSQTPSHSRQRQNTPVIRGKPPTPPPRERSRSPAAVRSPLLHRKQPPVHQPQQQPQISAYQQERHRIAANDYLSDEEDEGDFSGLTKLVPENRYSNGTATKGILKRPGSSNRQSLNNTPTSGYADSALDGSLTDRKDIYASPIPAHKRIGAHTPSNNENSIPRNHYGGNSATSTPTPLNRAETPAFPVNNRETPLPFHPLLYQGAGDQPSGFNAGITNRSGSPRSMYFGQSRRSSMTSTEIDVEVEVKEMECKVQCERSASMYEE